MPKLNETDQRVFNFIVEYKRTHDGVAPSYRDIVNATGVMSTSHVSKILDKLYSSSLISFEDGVPRSIQVVGGEWNYEQEEQE